MPSTTPCPWSTAAWPPPTAVTPPSSLPRPSALRAFAPDGIKLEGCGELTYLDAVAADTTATYTDGAFRFVHNHYAYEIPVQGTVEPLDCGYRLTGDVTLVMDKR